MEDAIQRFTERRMRPNFGPGVSIPSQLRWLSYVDRWTKGGKVYVERRMEIVEVSLFGLRDGVKVAVEGFIEEGKVIKTLHVFETSEREIVRGELRDRGRLADVVSEVMSRAGSSSRASSLSRSNSKKKNNGSPTAEKTPQSAVEPPTPHSPHDQASGSDVIYRPKERIMVPTSDVNIDFERRSTAAYNLTMVTAVAHVWFNAFFEGNGPENGGNAKPEGVFELAWDKLDGIKGSSRKGTRAFDRVAVKWKICEEDKPTIIKEPCEGQEVKQSRPADWHGKADSVDQGHQKDLGVRTATPSGEGRQGESQTVSATGKTDPDSADEGTQPRGKDGEMDVYASDDEDDLDKKGIPKSKTIHHTGSNTEKPSENAKGTGPILNPLATDVPASSQNHPMSA
jgi:hypothetical protein